MVAHAPIPPDEAERVADLHSYQILDTLADERFDLFTRLATWLFGVPMSAINLVDSERTFFKSAIGLPIYQPARCTSICAHAVGRGESLMVVEDLAQDARFHDHPLVLNLGARFYAGALLRSDRGHLLGTLCISDVRPRQLSADEEGRLIQLAQGVGSVLELHRRGLWLHQAAHQDSLTGLCNRRRLDECLEIAVARATAGPPCALLCLDLDGFKAVNDRFGHAGGDTLLREVARRLGAVVREPDIVARLGGDEFVVLVIDRSSLHDAEQLAQRVLASLAAPFAIEGEPVAIRGSIGLAGCPDHGTTAPSLLRCADLALYEAKQSGRSQYCVYGKPCLQPA